MLDVARERREELLRDAHAVVVEAVRDARSNPVRTVVIPSEGLGVDPDKVDRLIGRLTLQGVEVGRADDAFSARVRAFQELNDNGSRPTQRDFPAGSYLVDFVQPQARLARALLDPTLDYSDPQVEVPFGRPMPYYDVSWGNLALMFGVEAFASADAPPGGPHGATLVSSSRAGGAGTASTTGAGRGATGAAGATVTGGATGTGAVPGGGVGGVTPLDRDGLPYAYLLPAGIEASYRIAVGLMRDGYRVRVFQASTTIGTERHPAGTFALIRSRNRDGLPGRIAELAVEHGGRVISVAGPFTDAGVAFGDDARLAPITQPLVGVVADWPVAQDHVFGGIRNVLEADFGFAFSPLLMQTINSADLSKYSAVVLPHAGMSMRGGPNFSAGYRGLLNLENMRRYVRGGGTLIAVKGAAEVVAADEVLGAGITVDGWARQTNGAILRAEWTRWTEPAGRAGLETWRPGIGPAGAPLLSSGVRGPQFAAPGAYPLLMAVSEDAVSENLGAEVMARYGADPARLLMDGYMTDADRDVVAGRPFVIVKRVGRGRVIYFADSTTFRGNWYGLNLLFLNALLLGPTL